MLSYKLLGLLTVTTLVSTSGSLGCRCLYNCAVFIIALDVYARHFSRSLPTKPQVRPDVVVIYLKPGQDRRMFGKVFLISAISIFLESTNSLISKLLFLTFEALMALSISANAIILEVVLAVPRSPAIPAVWPFLHAFRLQGNRDRG